MRPAYQTLTPYAVMQHLSFTAMEMFTILKDWDLKTLFFFFTVVQRINLIMQYGVKSHLLWLYDPFNSKRKLAKS